MSTFVCKCIFGLGITSSADFVTLLHKLKPLREAGVAYITSLSNKYPARAGVVVFDGVRELFRCHKHIKPHQVVVISDIPSLLKEVRDVVPLDFDNTRSFEFNFKPVDLQAVVRAVRSKKLRVESAYTSFDNLGYHVDRVQGSDKFLTAFLALTSSLPFDKRETVRRAIVRFLSNKKPNASVVTRAVESVVEGTELNREQIEPFVQLFESNATKYFEAINSELAPAQAAKRFEVDQYALTYMKRMIRSHQVTSNRLARNGSTLTTA